MNHVLNPHPFGKVPCLQYRTNGENHILFESNAILGFFLDNFNQKLKTFSPHSTITSSKSVQENSERMQWVFWSSSFESECTTSIRLFKSIAAKKGLQMGQKVEMTPEEEEEMAENSKMVVNNLNILETVLDRRDCFILGNEFDVADLCLAFCLNGLDMIGLLEKNGFNSCLKYLKRCTSRDAFRKTMQEFLNVMKK